MYLSISQTCQLRDSNFCKQNCTIQREI